MRKGIMRMMKRTRMMQRMRMMKRMMKMRMMKLKEGEED